MAESLLTLAVVLGPAALLAIAGRAIAPLPTFVGALGEGTALFLAVHVSLATTVGCRPEVTLMLLLPLIWLMRGRPAPILAGKNLPRPGPDRDRAMATTRRVVTVVLTAALVMLVAERSTGHPGWDGWAIWELKARAIHREGRLDTTAVRDFERLGFSHPDYPPGLPILEALSMDLAGRPLEGIGTTWGAVLLAALVARLAPYPLVALWVLIAPPFLRGALAGQADTMVALATVMALEGMLTRRHLTLALAGVLAVLAKNEGVAIFAGILAGSALAEWSRLSAAKDERNGEATSAPAPSGRLAAVLAAPVALLPWMVLRWKLALSTDLACRGVAAPALWPRRLTQVLACLVKELFGFPHGGLGPLGILVVIAFAHWLTRRPRSGAVPAAALLLLTALLVDLTAYVVFATDLPWLLATSFRRVLAQLAPAAALLAVLIASTDGATVEGPRVDPAHARR